MHRCGRGYRHGSAPAERGLTTIDSPILTAAACLHRGDQLLSAIDWHMTIAAWYDNLTSIYDYSVRDVASLSRRHRRQPPLLHPAEYTRVTMTSASASCPNDDDKIEKSIINTITADDIRVKNQLPIVDAFRLGATQVDVRRSSRPPPTLVLCPSVGRELGGRFSRVGRVEMPPTRTINSLFPPS